MKPKLGLLWASLQFLARVSFYTLTLGAAAYTGFMVIKVFVKNPVEVLGSAALLVLPALFICALIRAVIWAGDRCGASASRRDLVRGAATVFDISGTGVVRYSPGPYRTWFSRDVNALNRDWDVILRAESEKSSPEPEP